jgi:hypothetical protein
MTAWATVVAERMGFRREEALSIGENALYLYYCISHTYRFKASVYTEMNAVSKGISLGIFDESRKPITEATRDGSQPYVDVMGRRYVAYLYIR